MPKKSMLGSLKSASQIDKLNLQTLINPNSIKYNHGPSKKIQT